MERQPLRELSLRVFLLGTSQTTGGGVGAEERPWGWGAEAEEAGPGYWGRSGGVPTYGNSWGPEELTDQGGNRLPFTADRPGQPKGVLWNTRVAGMAQGVTQAM